MSALFALALSMMRRGITTTNKFYRHVLRKTNGADMNRLRPATAPRIRGATET